METASETILKLWPTLKARPILKTRFASTHERLAQFATHPLTHSELNQLLHQLGQPTMEVGLFEFYFTSPPDSHPWDAPLKSQHIDERGIASVEQLDQGIRRFLVDALLYVGNIRRAYDEWREMDYGSLARFFDEKRIDTQRMRRRGPILSLQSIVADDRYLISQSACKAYQLDARTTLEDALRKAYRARRTGVQSGRFVIKDLLEDLNDVEPAQLILRFDTDDLVLKTVDSEAAIERRVQEMGTRFEAATSRAIANTDVYLSLCRDLDVYVATSMRTRDQFRMVAHDVEEIFWHDDLKRLNIRYFDPTMSASKCHEDKGLLECIMVRAAECLLYFDQNKDTWGKITEAAMGLTLGKPVIVVCPDRDRAEFLRHSHPLSRLVFHETGMAIGTMVVETNSDARELLRRLFTNHMKYDVVAGNEGYYRLIEEVSRSAVRVQTSDSTLLSAFREYYDRR